MNKIIIVGRFVKNPIMKYSPKGTSIAEFAIAESDSKEHTNFHRCVAYGTTANTIEKFCHKGDLIVVDGKVKQSAWVKDTEHGDKVHMNNNDVVVDRISFVSGGNLAPRKSYEDRGDAQNRNGDSLSEDDLYVSEDPDVPSGFAAAEADIPF